MATSKTLTPTNVTIQIPAMTDAPDQRVNSNCIDKEADAINALSDQIANAPIKKYGAVAAGQSVLIEVQAAYSIVFITRGSAAINGIYLIDFQSVVSTLISATNMTVTTSSSGITITNNNPSALVGYTVISVA